MTGYSYCFVRLSHTCFYERLTSRKLTKWMLILLDFYLEILHVSGKNKIVADTLTRNLSIYEDRTEPKVLLNNTKGLKY